MVTIDKELEDALTIIASKTNFEEYNRIKSVLFGLYAGCTYGFPEYGMEFLHYLDRKYPEARRELVQQRGLRVIK